MSDQEITVPRSRLVGRRLGAYMVLERIGGGGMSSVYRAMDRSSGRDVAIKVLPPGLAEIPHFTERFRREARVLMRLKHPFIVPVQDVSEAGDLAYLVMPLYPTGSLADRLQNGRLTLAETGRLIHQIASALDYAHRQAVVHRDVKPSNILIDDSGNALLSDFGLALIKDASASLTGSALLGTPAYISPELAQSNKVDARSDQYSLGIILFELVTGRLPFDDATPMATVLKHVSQPLPSPRSLSPDLPDGVEQVILKATAKKPQERFPSVAELNDQLQATLGTLDDAQLFARPPLRPAPEVDLTPSLGTNGHPHSERRTVSRRLGLGLLAGAVGVALLVGLSPVNGARSGAIPTASSSAASPTATRTRAAPALAASVEAPTRVPSPQPTVDMARRLAMAPTPTALPTVEVEDIRSILDLDRPDHFDYFDDPSTWYDLDRPGKAAYWFEEGRLVGRDYEPEEHYTWWSSAEKQSGNLYAEISATIGDCIEKDSLGLVIRVDPQQLSGGYGLEVSCDGHWRFRRHQIGGDPVDLSPWTTSTALDTGPWATNRLGIWAYLDEFVIYLNGQPVAELNDRLYAHNYGTFAVYVRASNTYDLTAAFDDFAFWHVRYLP